jgi:hypothetical protein
MNILCDEEVHVARFALVCTNDGDSLSVNTFEKSETIFFHKRARVAMWTNDEESKRTD